MLCDMPGKAGAVKALQQLLETLQAAHSTIGDFYLLGVCAALSHLLTNQTPAERGQRVRYVQELGLLRP